MKPKTELGKRRNREARKRYGSSYLLLCSSRKSTINAILKTVKINKVLRKSLGENNATNSPRKRPKFKSMAANKKKKYI